MRNRIWEWWQNIKIDDDRYLITSNLNSNPNGWCSFLCFQINSAISPFFPCIFLNQSKNDSISLREKKGGKNLRLFWRRKAHTHSHILPESGWLTVKWLYKAFRASLLIKCWFDACGFLCLWGGLSVCIWLHFKPNANRFIIQGSGCHFDLLFPFKWVEREYAWVKSHRSCVWIFSHSFFRTSHRRFMCIKCYANSYTRTHTHFNHFHHYFIYPQD